MSADAIIVWNTTHGDTVEVYETWWRVLGAETGEAEPVSDFRYRVRAANGEIVEQGSEGYTRQHAAVEAAERHHPVVPGGESS